MTEPKSKEAIVSELKNIREEIWMDFGCEFCKIDGDYHCDRLKIEDKPCHMLDKIIEAIDNNFNDQN